MATIIHEPVEVTVMAPHERELGYCDYGTSGLACQRRITDTSRRPARFWVKVGRYHRAACDPCLPAAVEEASERVVTP